MFEGHSIFFSSMLVAGYFSKSCTVLATAICIVVSIFLNDDEEPHVDEELARPKGISALRNLTGGEAAGIVDPTR